MSTEGYPVGVEEEELGSDVESVVAAGSKRLWHKPRTQKAPAGAKSGAKGSSKSKLVVPAISTKTKRATKRTRTRKAPAVRHELGARGRGSKIRSKRGRDKPRQRLSAMLYQGPEPSQERIKSVVFATLCKTKQGATDSAACNTKTREAPPVPHSVGARESEVRSKQATMGAWNKPRKLPAAPYQGPRLLVEGLYHCYYCKVSRKDKKSLGEHVLCHLPDELFCFVCGLGFPAVYKRFYRKHLRVHMKPLECHLCSYKTKNEAALKRHLSSEHGVTVPPAADTNGTQGKAIVPKRYKKVPTHSSCGPLKPFSGPRLYVEGLYYCYYCDYARKDKCLIRQHMVYHFPATLSCRICGWPFHTKLGLLNHLRSHDEEKPYKCDLCGFTTKWEASLKTHIERERERKRKNAIQKSFTCFHCGYTTTRKYQIIMHMHRHLPGKYRCKICGYRAHKPHTLDVHMRTHTGEKPYCCTLCGFRCTQKSTLESHAKSHEAHNYPCDRCPLAFIRKVMLTNHINTVHLGLPNYRCSECDFETAQPFVLKRHLRHVHGRTDVKIKCRFCDFATDRTGTFAYHDRVHTGEKPFACDRCDYTCAQKNGLQRHAMTHQQLKPYKCELCDYRSCARSGVTRHMAVHSTVRPHKCSFCSLMFKTLQTAQLHEKSVHKAQAARKLARSGKKTSVCSECGVKFFDKATFSEHKLRHKNEQALLNDSFE